MRFSRRTRWRRTLSTAVCLLALPVLVAGTGGSAQANPTEGYITGAPFRILSIDWAGEGEITRWSHANSNAAGLWQAILWADGAIELNGTPFDLSDIDCQFGPNTEQATKSWQATRGIGVDGRVGPQTFGMADNQLRWGPDAGNGQRYVYYLGREGIVLRFLRDSASFAYLGSWDRGFFYYGAKDADCGGDPSL
ncbi:MAG: peptidoglycan-binding protein [Sporichthyaceae bacterium]|nr:peptidoglycan-binding protein [Sporichthyaceae bacterium]